jgi:ArsR family transcriptional regulator
MIWVQRGQTVSSRAKPGLAELSDVLKVLSDPTRLMIFEQVMQGVQCNCELGDCLDLPMNLISHHLKVLREAGLINAQRDLVDMRWVYYSVNQEALARLREDLCAFLDPERIRQELPACRAQS